MINLRGSAAPCVDPHHPRRDWAGPGDDPPRPPFVRNRPVGECFACWDLHPDLRRGRALSPEETTMAWQTADTSATSRVSSTPQPSGSAAGRGEAS
jgi:hypothetical protein